MDITSYDESEIRERRGDSSSSKLALTGCSGSGGGVFFLNLSFSQSRRRTGPCGPIGSLQMEGLLCSNNLGDIFSYETCQTYHMRHF